MLGGSLVTSGMVHPQVGDGGEGLQILRVAVNILNKQLQTANKGWSSSLWLGVGLTTLRHKNVTLQNISRHLRPGLIFWHDLSNGKRT